MRFILALILALLVTGTSNSYYHRRYYYYTPVKVGWKWYSAGWYSERYWKAGYYAYIGNKWHLQGHGPYDGEAVNPAPAPKGKGGLTPEEINKLKELLKKLEP